MRIIFLIAIALIFVAIGLGYLFAVETPLIAMCSGDRGCRVHRFFYALFGERGGRLAMASVWVSIGVLLAFAAMRSAKSNAHETK